MALTPEFQFRHQALLVLLACMTGTSLLSLAFTPLLPFKPTDLLQLLNRHSRASFQTSVDKTAEEGEIPALLFS